MTVASETVTGMKYIPSEMQKQRDRAKDEVKDVVDIAQDTFTRASDTLYVNSTFYDYSTDYELNGNNQ